MGPELLRALLKTLKVSGEECRRVCEIRNTIDYCFHLWTADGGDRVTREAFLEIPNGLGEQLLCSLYPDAPEGTSNVSGRSDANPTSPETPPPMLGEASSEVDAQKD